MQHQRLLKFIDHIWNSFQKSLQFEWGFRKLTKWNFWNSEIPVADPQFWKKNDSATSFLMGMQGAQPAVLRDFQPLGFKFVCDISTVTQIYENSASWYNGFLNNNTHYKVMTKRHTCNLRKYIWLIKGYLQDTKITVKFQRKVAFLALVVVRIAVLNLIHVMNVMLFSTALITYENEIYRGIQWSRLRQWNWSI